jgi:hypothetical protein
MNIPAIGGFFFWEDGDVNRRSTYREFPFDCARLATEERGRLRQSSGFLNLRHFDLRPKGSIPTPRLVLPVFADRPRPDL